MRVREIEAKTILSSAKHPDPWFGVKYTMNLYRGCQHHCIYCDSRSECYQIADFDGEILVKTNALERLRDELARKRTKGYVSTGSMNDPYMPVERVRLLARGALEIVAALRFPVHIITKSDLVTRDADLLRAIRDATGEKGAVVSFTITTPDDDLARQIEPGAPPSSARLAAMQTLAARGLWVGVTLMPVLPAITDDEASIRRLIEAAADYGAKYVIPAWGMTLRDRQRSHYYAQLDRLFPGLREKYERAYGDRYSAGAPNAVRLEAAFAELAQRRRLERAVAPWSTGEAKQLALF
ncbi:MAG: radical SAM protein [Anaerolineae bacterium]|nr:radical SAM protein [Anaerolineae bacterium]